MRMMTVASVFEGTTFNVLSSGFAAVSLLVAVFAAYSSVRGPRSAKPSLVFRERSVASILSSASRDMTGIAVTRNGEALDQPHVAVVEIENIGRQAVRSELFDQDRPIVVEFNARVLEVIKASYQRGEGSVGFRHSVYGTSVHLGPDLLPEKSVLTLQALTSGKPKLGKVDNHLIDVKTSVHASSRSQTSASGLRRRVAFAVLTIVMVALGSSVIRDTLSSPPNLDAHMAVSLVTQGDQRQVLDDLAIFVRGYSFKENESLTLTIIDEENRVRRGADVFAANESGEFGWAIVMATPGENVVSWPKDKKTVYLNILRADGAKLVTAYELKGA